jgi:hypothetical protein
MIEIQQGLGRRVMGKQIMLYTVAGIAGAVEKSDGEQSHQQVKSLNGVPVLGFGYRGSRIKHVGSVNWANERKKIDSDG